MTTSLSKPLSRELTKYPGVIVTLTETGITFKVKRRHKSVDVSWEKIFGTMSMRGENENILLLGADAAMRELGYHDYLRSLEN